MDSRYIGHRLHELRDRKSKNAFLESVMSDPTATILNESNGHKTILFPGNKGPKSNVWEETKRMAFELNENGFDVAFLLELESYVCADSLIKKGQTFKIADFKYCVTTKSNTLVKELEHGFEQGDAVVLKLVNMDSGVLKEAVDYLFRNKMPFGDIILLNRYGKTLVINHKDIKSKAYARKIKGFL